jgi:hypothetical protein
MLAHAAAPPNIAQASSAMQAITKQTKNARIPMEVMNGSKVGWVGTHGGLL